MAGLKAKTSGSYDAVILGAGVAGLGAAYALGNQKKKVLVLKPAKRLAGESTPASAGILDPFLESASPDHVFFKFKKKSFQKLPSDLRRIERESGHATGYEKTGMLFAALTPREEQKLKRRLTSHRPAGLPIRWISANKALKRWPYLNPALRGVLYYPSLGRVFPDQMQESLAKAAVRKHGVEIKPASGRIKVLMQGGVVSGLAAGQKIYKTNCVINAAGSWADALRVTPLRFPVYPIRGQVLLVRGRIPSLKQVVHSAGGTYIVPWQNGTYLLGSTVEKVGFKASVGASAIRKIHADAARLIPQLKGLRTVKTWAGLRPCSKDHLPLLGQTRLPGFFMAAGYYRSGIVISLYAGRKLAEGLIQGRFSSDLRSFSPLRFKQRK